MVSDRKFDYVVFKHGMMDPVYNIADGDDWRPDYSHIARYRRLVYADDPAVPGFLLPCFFDEWSVGARVVFELISPPKNEFTSADKASQAYNANIRTTFRRLNTDFLFVEVAYREGIDAPYAPVPDLFNLMDRFNREVKLFAESEPRADFLELPEFKNNEKLVGDAYHLTDDGIVVLADLVTKKILESSAYQEWKKNRPVSEK